jgi:large subunit ribosomal protein L3
MLTGLLGRKIGMTQIFREDGRVEPVTVLQAGPCYVTQIKTKKTDGYNAVQISFDDTRKKQNTPKPLLTHFEKAGVKPCRYVKELRLGLGDEIDKGLAAMKLGDPVKVDILENVWKVNISGVTKGHGFAGMVKRHNKKRGPESHGSMNVRGPGAIGSDTRLTHIRPGKTMPGHYGVDKQTMMHLEVIKIDKEKNLLFVKGAVPGHKQGYVIVKKTSLVKPVVVVETKGKKGKQGLHKTAAAR